MDANPVHLVPTPTDAGPLCIVIAVEHTNGLKTREFLADVTYATEKESDIHGIAFGQRLIDGKREGRSVMDMQLEDRRATPRFRVQFRTTVSDPSKTEGTARTFQPLDPTSS